ncbi:MAG: hypothetical protein FH749_12090 [Firmicutes bacterium]|nr:hypothetical protein [Bacillota bacterium]
MRLKTIVCILLVLMLAGCGGKALHLEAEEIILLRTTGDYLPAAYGEQVKSLLQAFNDAQIRSQARSGRATHRLTLVTEDSRIVRMNRIREDLTEVLLTDGTERNRFYLLSEELSAQIAQLSDSLAAE